MSEKEYGYSKKELALFSAVLELIEEGTDIYSLKVSDITNKAGIGKGTAYEYFSSKEEMISKAIIWSGVKHFERIKSMLEKKESMEEQIEGFLDYIDKEMTGNKWNEHMINLLNHSCSVGERIQKEFSKCGKPERKVLDILQIFIKQGREEGSISPELSDGMVYMTLGPGFLGYFKYKMELPERYNISPEKMKRFVCRNMLRSLSDAEGL